MEKPLVCLEFFEGKTLGCVVRMRSFVALGNRGQGKPRQLQVWPSLWLEFGIVYPKERISTIISAAGRAFYHVASPPLLDVRRSRCCDTVTTSVARYLGQDCIPLPPASPGGGQAGLDPNPASLIFRTLEWSTTFSLTRSSLTHLCNSPINTCFRFRG